MTFHVVHDKNSLFFAHVVAIRFRKSLLEPLDTFGTETKLKVHRFTNNLQGLQKVMVKDLS